MRKRTLFLTACAIISLASFGKTNSNNNMNMENNLKDCRMCSSITAEEIAAICKPLDLYVEAAIKGDSKIAYPAFAQTATMSYVENGKLISVPIKALFDYYVKTGKQPASYEITDCNVAEDVAIVRIESKFGDTEFTDMFTLAKEGDDWKIISKVYHVK